MTEIMGKKYMLTYFSSSADENRSQCPEVQVGENSQQSKDPNQVT